MNAEHCESDQVCVERVLEGIINDYHQLSNDIEKESNKNYVTKRGDTLFRIFHEELEINNYLGAYPKIIKTNFSDGRIVYEQTMSDFKEIEVGDMIYIEDGSIMIERSPIEKYKYVIEGKERNIYNITNKELNLGFSVKKYHNTEQIFFKEVRINDISEMQLSGYFSLGKGDILTVKCVNGVWQYLMERPLKTIKTDDIAIPILSDQKKEKTQKLLKLQEQEKPLKEIKKKEPLGATKYYARKLSKGLPESKQTEFLTELARRLNEFNQSEKFKTLNLDKLDAKYTEIRIKWGREFFSKLSGKEFEIFYRNKGVGPRAFGTLMGNILGKDLSVVTPDIKDIKGKYANDQEIKRFIDKKYGSLIRECTSNDTLFKAIIKRETKGDSYAVSKAGAIGVMQLMPDLFGFSKEFPKPINPFNPSEAIARGIIAFKNKEKRSKQLISKNIYDTVSSFVWALYFYNFGDGNMNKLIKKYGTNYKKHLPKETRNYAILIQKYMRTWESPNLLAQE